MKYVPPITDRTAEDIATQTDKAFFNVADWVRVYGNAELVKTIVEIVLSISITFDAVAEPTTTSIPTVAAFNTLLANINRIRLNSRLSGIDGLVAVNENWTAGISEDAPTYDTVNEWELVLDLIRDNIYLSITYYTVYCGVANAGQPRFYQSRWRQYNFVLPSLTPVRRARTGNATCGVGLTRNNYFRRYA
jgi:hypothetical protein